jgi:hypothetical protein
LIEYGNAHDIGYDLINISNIVNDSDEYDHNLSDQVDLAHYQTALKLSERAYQAFKNLSRQTMSLTGNDPSVLTKLEDNLADPMVVLRPRSNGRCAS